MSHSCSEGEGTAKGGNPAGARQMMSDVRSGNDVVQENHAFLG